MENASQRNARIVSKGTLMGYVFTFGQRGAQARKRARQSRVGESNDALTRALALATIGTALLPGSCSTGAPGWSATNGGAVVRAGWATMVANNATSAAAKFSVSALWPCQWSGRRHRGT
jgi:hypothetical protein